jgi:hypothetical protein
MISGLLPKKAIEASELFALDPAFVTGVQIYI